MAHVLIVDDDLDIADLSRELLEAAGYRTRIAHTGEEGLACLSAERLPDCVLLDVDMPVLDGPGMAHRMLVHNAGQESVPILLVSARDDLPELAARMGTPYFLAKASADYGRLLLKILDRALTERRAPLSA